MKKERVPLEKFAKIGITKKDLDQMPEHLRDTILKGHLSPLMRLNVPVGDNSKVSIPMKIQLTYDKAGKLQLLTYQIHRDIDNKLSLNAAELERMRKGETIQKEFRKGDDRKLRYVQLDKETNSLMYRDVATVKIQQKLREMEKINDVGLGINQKQAAVEGKPVELEIGDQKVSVGVDLRQPEGFKVVQGDMDEWRKQQAVRYDDAHQGYMGYVQTDENRWEYRQVVDKLDTKEEQKVTEGRKKEKSKGMKM